MDGMRGGGGETLCPLAATGANEDIFSRRKMLSRGRNLPEKAIFKFAVLSFSTLPPFLCANV